MGIDETALVTCQKDGSLSLLNRLAETTGGKVDFATEALRLIVTKELLEHRGAGNQTLDSRAACCGMIQLTSRERDKES